MFSNAAYRGGIARVCRFARTGADFSDASQDRRVSDMSSLYSDIAGSGSTVAARMAVEDFAPPGKA